MEPGVIALLAGVAGAVLTLLIVLLAFLGFAAPVVRAALRFAGNFDNATAQRRGGRIVFSGAFDDWRQPEIKSNGLAHGDGAALVAPDAN